MRFDFGAPSNGASPVRVLPGVRIYDPQRNRTLRILLELLAWLLVALSATVNEAATQVPVLLLSLCAFLSTAAFGPKVRIGDVTLGAGKLGGLRSVGRTIATKRIVAASMTRDEDGTSAIAISFRGAPEPVVLRGIAESDREEVRRAFDVPHTGVGSLTWSSGADATRTVLGFFQAIGGAFLGMLGLLIAHSSGTGHSGSLIVAASVYGIALLLLKWSMGGEAGAPIVLDAYGVHFLDRRRNRISVPYGAIESASSTKSGIVLTISELGADGRPTKRWVTIECDLGRALFDRMSGNVGAFVKSHIISQIASAAARARGAVILDSSLEDPTLEMARGPTERVADWFARIETLSASYAMAAEDPYRSDEMHKTDLKFLLANPDCPLSVRIAAARILSRVQPEAAPAIISGVLDTIRDETIVERLRIGLGDDVAQIERDLLDESWVQERAARRQY